MILDLFIDAAGMEQVATGGKLYSWHFTARPQAASGEVETPLGARYLDSVQVELPDDHTCRTLAAEALKSRLQSIRAEAYVAEQEVQKRLDNLLALTFEEYQNV